MKAKRVRAYPCAHAQTNERTRILHTHMAPPHTVACTPPHTRTKCGMWNVPSAKNQKKKKMPIRKTKDDEQKSTLNIFSEPKNDRINFPIDSRILISDGLLEFSFKAKRMGERVQATHTHTHKLENSEPECRIN